MNKKNDVNYLADGMMPVEQEGGNERIPSYAAEDAHLYQELRNAFKKCAVAVSKGRITLVFPQYADPRFVGVSCDDDEMKNRHIFEKMLDSCSEFSVVLRPGLDTRLAFKLPISVEKDYVFPPLEKELSERDIEEIIRSRGSLPRREFLEAFSQADLCDDEEILAGISELLRQDRQGEVLEVNKLLDWPTIKGSAVRFHDSSHFGSLAIENPDKYVSSGSAAFSFESERPKSYSLSGQHLDQFRHLVKTANWYSLDGFSAKDSASFVLSFFS